MVYHARYLAENLSDIDKLHENSAILRNYLDTSAILKRQLGKLYNIESYLGKHMPYGKVTCKPSTILKVTWGFLDIGKLHENNLRYRKGGFT